MTIFYKIPEPSTGSTPRSTSPAFDSFTEFKKIAAQVIKAVGAKNLPLGKRKWKAIDMLVVLVYAWLRGVSPDHASNKLNDIAIEKGWFKPVTFADGRHSRAVPHQNATE